MKQPSSITVEVYIKDGRFRSNQNTLKDIMNAFEGQTVSITFKKKMNQRSLRQNKYYWGAIVPIWRNAFKEEWGDKFIDFENENIIKFYSIIKF